MKTWFKRVVLRNRPTFTIEAKVIRADGRVEELGVISRGKGHWKARGEKGD